MHSSTGVHLIFLDVFQALHGGGLFLLATERVGTLSEHFRHQKFAVYITYIALHDTDVQIRPKSKKKKRRKKKTQTGRFLPFFFINCYRLPSIFPSLSLMFHPFPPTSLSVDRLRSTCTYFHRLLSKFTKIHRPAPMSFKFHRSPWISMGSQLPSICIDFRRLPLIFRWFPPMFSDFHQFVPVSIFHRLSTRNRPISISSQFPQFFPQLLLNSITFRRLALILIDVARIPPIPTELRQLRPTITRKIISGLQEPSS